MLAIGIWQPTDGDIAISYGLHLEDLVSSGNPVERVVDAFQEGKYL
jgi:hypothetical protein